MARTRRGLEQDSSTFGRHEGQRRGVDARGEVPGERGARTTVTCRANQAGRNGGNDLPILTRAKSGGTIKRGYLLRLMPSAPLLQWFGAIGLAGLLSFDVNSSAAGESAYCITCTGPDQTYLCRVTGEGSSQNDVFKLYCIVRTARQGRHASCAATGSGESCHGVVKNYNYRGPFVPASLAENPRVKRFISRMEENQATDLRSHSPPRQKAADPPTHSRFQRVRHFAYNAGAAVRRFGGTTYRCLCSLFRNCSGEAR